VGSKHKRAKRTSRFFLLICLLFAVFLPAGSGAQEPEKIWKIGVLASSTPALNAARDEALREGLRKFGYAEGKNITLVFRYAQGKLDRLPVLARELLQERVDIMIAGGTAGAVAAKQATSTTPIVLAGVGDVVKSRLVKTFSFPGGNVTGVSRSSSDFIGKRLEIFKQLDPKITRVAALANRGNPGAERNLKELDIGARTLGISVQPVMVKAAGDFDGAFQTAMKEQADALFLMPDALFNSHIPRIVELAAKNRLPATYPRSDYVEAGGLMSYAVNLLQLTREAAWYVDKIIKGMKPEELAVTEPEKFELVINFKTANQIGLTISPNVLARADRVLR
jgi:putative ABC transport system substrate-binding protein